MEGLQNFVRNVSKEIQSATSSSEKPYDIGGKLGAATTASISSSANHSHVLMARPPRTMVSAWTCSKLCLFFFAAGVVAGYTLKKRVRGWASKLLKRIKDD
ncbi:hypothetical protein LINGRAHAP2_LOCUS2591 [Linum grandiflorum]